MERFFRSQSPGNNGCRRKMARAEGGAGDRRRKQRKYDAAATREIIAQYGHIVKFIAHKLAFNLPPAMEIGDLINVGLVGLMDAAERFDAARGFKFQTFAEFRVRGAMLDELRRQDWVPRGARERAREYEEVCKELKKTKGRKPTHKEVGQKMGLPEKKIQDLENSGGVAKMVRFEHMTNLEAEGENAVEFSQVEVDFSPYEIASRKNIRTVMEKVIHHLPERLQSILVMYYFEDLSLKEIGDKLQVTESRVSQLHTRAIVEMRKVLDEHNEYSELKRLLVG